MNTPVPPRAERLLRWSLSPLERPAILGDLEEEHAALVQVTGAKAADRWYSRQVLRSIPPNLWRRLQADPRRSAHFHQGLRAVTLGALCSMPRLFVASERATPSLFWSFYGLFGVSQIAVALFYKRVEPPRRQRLLEKWWVTGIVVLWFTLMPWSWLGPALSQWIGLLLFLVPALLPRLPADPVAEIRVQPKHSSGLGPPVWSLELPSESLGLSGLVLRREWDTTSPHAARLPPVTIQRTFAPSDTLRVCAAVNLSGRGERASVELLDRLGKQVWQAPAPLITGKLVEVPATLDELADRDPADHFGLIDEALPLAALAPGPYRLRVTVANDIFQSSSSDEVITIAPSQKP